MNRVSCVTGPVNLGLVIMAINRIDFRERCSSLSLDNIDANIDQNVKQISECSNTIGFMGCDNGYQNVVHTGALHSTDGVSTLSDVDFHITQKGFQNNKCADGMSLFCSNSNNNEVYVGYQIFSPGTDITISNVDGDIEQKSLENNQCKALM